MDEIRVKAAKGAIWSAGAQAFTHAFQFIVTAILARILTPNDFGNVGIVVVFLEFNVLLGDLGLSAALIQRKKLESDHLNSAFWAQFLVNILIYAVTVFLSSRIAAYYGNPVIRVLVVVLTFNALLEGISAVPRALLARSMNFKAISIVRGTTELISGSSALALAFGGAGIWALAARGVIGKFSHTIMMWRKVVWRPKFRLKFGALRELLPFGLKVTGSDLLEFMSSNLDYVIVGKMLGTHALGIYTLAYKLISFPLEKIASIIARVTFSALSAVQDDREQIKQWLLDVTRITSIVVAPLITGLFLMAPELVKGVWGDRWLEAIVPIQLLSIAGLSLVMEKPARTILLATGAPGLILRFDLLKGVILSAALLIAARQGISEVSMAVASVVTLVSLLTQIITLRKMQVRVFGYLRSLSTATLGCAAMAACLTCLKWATASFENSPVVLLMAIILGAATYCSILWIRERRSIMEAISHLKMGTKFHESSRDQKHREVQGDKARLG